MKRTREVLIYWLGRSDLFVLAALMSFISSFAKGCLDIILFFMWLAAKF